MKAPKQKDVRSAAERAAADRAAQESIERANYFDRLRAMPNFGYDEKRLSGLEPAYSQALGEMEEDLSQSFARLGFGPTRTGPQAAAVSRETQRMSTAKAAHETTDRNAWQRYVESSGTAELPAVPQTSAGMFYQRAPSPFASILGTTLGSLAGGFGSGYGFGLGIPGSSGSPTDVNSFINNRESQGFFTPL